MIDATSRARAVADLRLRTRRCCCYCFTGKHRWYLMMTMTTMMMMIRMTTEKKPTTSKAATTSLVGCLASLRVARRVFTRHSSVASHIPCPRCNPRRYLFLFLSLPLSSYETQTACSDSPSDGYEIRAPDLMDHFFLLDPTLPSRRPSLFLPLFLLSEYLAHPRDSPLSFYLPIFRRQIFARAESDFRAPSWPMTTVRPRARHTSHFSSPLLPNSTLGFPAAFSLSLTCTRTSYVCATVARTRARTHTNTYIYTHERCAQVHTARERTSTSPLTVFPFSVILSSCFLDRVTAFTGVREHVSQVHGARTRSRDVRALLGSPDSSRRRATARVPAETTAEHSPRHGDTRES